MTPANEPSVNVASHLARLASETPDRVAIYFPSHGVNLHGTTEYDKLTFRQLHQESDAVAHGLTHAGVTRGTRIALMVPSSLEFFTLVFGLFKAAAVPVLIDPGLGVNGIGACLAEAEPTAFIGIPKAHLARRLFRWGKKTIHTSINVGRRRFYCHHSLEELINTKNARRPFPMPEVSAKEPAAVLFTSGSTGPAKGALYSHGNFAAQVEALKTTFNIRPGEIDLCTFPLFALFGPALGMTCVIPDMDFTRPGTIDPDKAFAQIQQFEVTNLFGSPAVLRKFVTNAASGGRKPPIAAGKHDAGDVRLPLATLPLASVRRVISAGAPVPATVIEPFTRLLSPDAEVFTPYGATEALPVTNIGSRELLSETRHLTEQGKGICIGRPVAGMEVRIIRISDKPIPEWDDSLVLPTGEIGEITVRGPVVTRSYLNRPEANKLAKIRDGDTIWHRMGDVGYFDETGRIWYCGRKGHRVVTPTQTLYTEMVEGVFNTVPGVFRTALVGVSRNGITYPVVCVEYEQPQRSSFQAEEILIRRAEQFQFTHEIATFLVHPGSFPTDIRHNSKIFREKLAVWADKTLGPKWNPAPSTEPTPPVEAPQ